VGHTGFFVWEERTGLRFELRASEACKAGILLLEPHLQSILLWLFWKWSLVNCFSRLSSNLDLPTVSFPSS
jgi:hypothetical protein